MSWRNNGRSFRERNDFEYANPLDDLSTLPDLDIDVDLDGDEQIIGEAMADNLVDLDDVAIDEESTEDLFAEIPFRHSQWGSRLAYD